MGYGSFGPGQCDYLLDIRQVFLGLVRVADIVSDPLESSDYFWFLFGYPVLSCRVFRHEKRGTPRQRGKRLTKPRTPLIRCGQHRFVVCP
jgi:hypothetical protein